MSLRTYLEMLDPAAGGESPSESIAKPATIREVRLLLSDLSAEMDLVRLSAELRGRLGTPPLDLQAEMIAAAVRLLAAVPELEQESGVTREMLKKSDQMDGALSQAQVAIDPVVEAIGDGALLLSAELTQEVDALDDDIDAQLADEALPLEQRDRVRIHFGREILQRSQAEGAVQARRERVQRRRSRSLAQLAQVQKQNEQLIAAERLTAAPLPQQ